MKSNIKGKTENNIVLSIGMIVKNEEKHLDKCLSALQKLRDNVSNELIIVDTGSTDKTKEIALKYTDKVYDFEWINDFSAARNYGLEKAVGEWFMFIDADEYLDEDCEEMIKFFNMTEVREKYNSASFYIRNYGNKSKKNANQFLAPRLVRLTEGIRFHDPIHEWIPQPIPHGFFTTVFHHYGYIYDSEKSKKAKSDRNFGPLMKEYEENPNDLRVLSHMCDIVYSATHFKSFESKEKIHLKYLDEARKNVNDPYAPGAFIKGVIFYLNHEKYKKAICLADEYLKLEYADKTISTLSLYYLLSLAYLNMEDYEKCFEATQKYFEFYDKYKKGNLEMLELRFCILNGLTEFDYEEILMYAARCLNNLEKYDEALEYLEKIDISDMSFDHLRLFLNIFRDLTEQTKNYLPVIHCYDKILKLNDPDKTGLCLFLLEQYYMEHLSERDEFIEAIAESGVDGKYVELMQLVKKDNNGEDISNELVKFLDSTERWIEGYSEALYLSMKHNLDLNNVIAKMSHNELRDNLTVISDGHIDYSITALNYCKSVDVAESIKKMLWSVFVLEAAVYKSNELNHEQKRELYDLFLCTLSDYVLNIYNPELLNPEDADVLPELHRFGYYMTLAFTAKNNNDDIAYIRTLKEALRLCEPMKDLVSFYLSEFEEELRSKN